MQNRLLAIVVAIVLAVVAAMALVVYASSADRRAINEQAPVPVYVAARVIKQGESIDQATRAGKIKIVQYPRRLVAPNAVRALTQLSGKVAEVDILANEQLVDSRWVSQEEVEGQNLLTIKPGFQAVSIQVEASKQVSGFVTVNNHVNVYVTIDKAGGPVTQLLLADVKVLAVGATAQGTTAAQPPGRNGNLSTLTLEVRDQQVDKLVFAADNGRLYLTLVPPTGGPTPQGAPTGIGNLFN